MPSSSTSSSDRTIDPPARPHVTAPPAAAPGVARLVAFFALLVAVVFAIQGLIDYGLRHITTSGYGVSNAILGGQVNAEILINGSSRALQHFDSRLIEQATHLKTFNIGRDGAETDMQLAVLKAYLKHNQKPRLVIHNLDMFSFTTTREVYDPGQYLPYLYEDELYRPLLKIDPETWKWKYIPLYGYSVEDMRFTWLRGLGGALGINPPQDYFQGYRPAFIKWRNDFDRYKEENANGVRFPVEPQGIRDLEEVIAVCRRQNIPVLLVYSPVYYEMQQLERNRDEVFAQFQILSKRWQAPVWDYSSSPICRRQELFYNSQHLNHEGATAFSTELAARLAAEQPWK